MNSLTDFERRVTSWEHEAKETLSDLIKFGVIIRGSEKGGFRDHLLINTAGSTDKTKFVKEIGNVEITQRNTHTACSDRSQDQKFKRHCSWCGTYGHMARDCRKKTEYMQNNQNSGWSGTDDKGKRKPGKGKGQGKQDKDKGRGKLVKYKSKNKKKGRCQHHGKKGKNRFHEMEGHEDKQERQNWTRIHRVDGLAVE